MTNLNNSNMELMGEAKKTTNIQPGKTAVVGDKDIILLFKVLGIEIFPAKDPYKLKDTLKKLIENQYSIILITQTEYQSVADFISTRTSQPYPIILPIPGGREEESVGLAKINENISKVGMK